MKLKLAAILVVCMLALAFLAIPIRQVHAAPTQLVFDPSSVTKNPGDAGSTFTWPVKVVDVENLYGFDINVTWNNALLTFKTVSYTTELNAIWTATHWEMFINRTAVTGGIGSYKLVAFSTQNEFDLPTGSQALFTITFNIVGQSSNHDKTTTLDFVTAKLSDKNANPITNTPVDGTYTMTGTKPTVSMSPTTVLASILNSEFTVTLRMTDAIDVNGFGFEVHFDTTLLDYVSVTWGDLGSGTVTPDESGGKVTGNVGPHVPSLNGAHDLAGLKFKASNYHVWKNPSITPWQNILTGTIFYQTAELTYPSDSTLHYVRSSVLEINVGSDVTYTWSPIKGDVNLSGLVDIFDLAAVAGFYEITPTNHPTLWDSAEPRYELTIAFGEQIIDLYDLIVIASNWYATSP